MKTKRQLFEEHPEQFMLKCGVCGKMFLPDSYDQYKNLLVKSKKYNRMFYCSQKCRNDKFGTKKCHCDNCDKEFDVKKYNQEHRKHHFCSKDCFVEYKRKTSNSNKIGTCLNCNEQFVVVKNNKGKFCSKQCEIEFKYKETDAKIENKENTSHRVLKNYLLRHYNKCMNPDCKWDWNSEIKPVLELHHIDGNHKNNTIDNCILLCPNCHSLTDNYKFKKSHRSTRQYRKLYYKKD